MHSRHLRWALVPLLGVAAATWWAARARPGERPAAATHPVAGGAPEAPRTTPAAAAPTAPVACDVMVTGTIRDVSGGVIAGARVALRDSPLRVETDAQGHYRLCAPADGTLDYGADGYAAQLFFLPGAGARAVEHDVALAPESVIAGTALGPGEVPVPGAAIAAECDDDRTQTAAARADDTGRFRLAGLRPCLWSLRATAGALRSEQPVEVVSSVGKEVEVVVPLTARPGLSGVLLLDGKPLAGAPLEIFFSPSYESLRAATGDDGGFAFPGAPRGMGEVQVKGYEVLEPRHVAVDDADVRVTLAVAEQASIHGRVLHDGQPVADATVRGGRTHAASDAAGAFVLRGLLPGTHTVVAESRALKAFSRETQVAVGKGERVDDIVLELDLEGSIAGVVTDTEGTPLANVYVRVTGVTTGDLGWDFTDAAGRFLAGSLAGGEDYAPEVRAELYAPLPFPPAGGAPFAPQTVKDGRAHVTGVRLVVDTTRKTISGRVLRGGAPVPDAIITARLTVRGHRGYDKPTATTDRDGRFSLTGLVPASYDLSARAGDAEEEIAEIAAGRSDVTFSLPELGAIEGTLEGFAEAPIVEADGSGVRRRAQLAGQSFRLADLPVGRYRLLARTRAAQGRDTVDVTAGAVAHATLRSGGSARVTGRVVELRSGKPVAGLICGWTELTLYDVEAGGVLADAQGRFAVDVPAGEEISVGCPGNDRTSGAGRRVELAAGGKTHVELVTVDWRITQGSGVAQYTDGSGVVTFVDPEAPADPRLEVGDRILSVDGTPTAGLDQLAIEALIQDHAAGQAAILLVARGEKTITVRVTPPREAR